MRELSGRTAFITGGASGIGLGIARALLQAGMRVMIADIRDDHIEAARHELASARGAVHFLRLDVTDRPAMEQAAAETVRVFERVHVLCNNAGIGLLTPIKKASFKDWDWMINVNLNAVFNGVHAFLPHLRAHKEGGHIVSTASMGGLMVTDNAGVYSTCKFGVVAMMQCLRQDLAAEDIGVSVLCPAAVRTNIYQHESMRPPQYQAKGPASASQHVDESERIKGMLAMGMDPAEVGQKVLRGIVANQLYIFSHPMPQPIQERRDALLASLPKEPVNTARLAMDMKIRQMMQESLKRG